MMELTKAGTSDALVINGISKRAFDSDVAVGAPAKAGPPGYQSVKFLDTPVWNIRTNAFYQKLGYVEYKREGEFVYYTK